MPGGAGGTQRSRHPLYVAGHLLAFNLILVCAAVFTSRIMARKRTADRTIEAVASAFLNEGMPEDVLDRLLVPRSGIRRLIVSSVLSTHGSVRGICDHVEAVAERTVSEETVVHVLREAFRRAEDLNRAEKLGTICEGAHDEILLG